MSNPVGRGRRSSLLVAFTMGLVSAGPGQEASPSNHETFVEDFEEASLGEEPDLLVLEGRFTVEAEEGGNRILQLAPEPLVEGSIQLGPSRKAGSEIRARIKGMQSRRSYPRFGVGLHGLSGFKLKVVPSHRALHLLHGEEMIQSVPFRWTAGQWYVIRLQVDVLSDSRWGVSGWVWPEASAPPEEALIHYIADAKRLQGKGSVSGTPYSGTPILFDDIRITARPSPE